MNKDRPPEPLDFFIWTVEDVGKWLEEIHLGSYRPIFRENGVNGEYLEGMSMFTTEQILRFIRRCHMKWGDFITLCKELRRIKVACLKGEQKVRRPWWAPSCLSVVFIKAAKRNSLVVLTSIMGPPFLQSYQTFSSACTRNHDQVKNGRTVVIGCGKALSSGHCCFSYGCGHGREILYFWNPIIEQWSFHDCFKE
ncbi:Dual specificity protein kinase [Heracleum sosnowskyi]|uniref:Dual specificity protein kinase n=1 Tax=Heracleum sosnowskyi TaxID=360622 RepID=A0AAD8GRB6_9APIA|nr:Dual specificity protein kinase [Heracleum sosnowskyi]